MRHVHLLFACSLLALSCRPKDTLTVSEAEDALIESSTSSQAESLMANGVEISTNFTIGQAVQRAAQELRTFVASQLPCAQLTLTDATLSIEYGKNPGSCVYNGHSFGGKHTISVMRNDNAEVLVHHEWVDFNNGKVAVDGKADVTWSLQNKSRRVVHQITWTVLTGLYKDRTGTGSGDRAQTALAGGVREGIRIDGTRAWDGERGHFSLDINGIELRWIDPVPQAGSYVLDTPYGKTLTLEFQRVSASLIQVTVSGPARSFSFDVSALGQVSRRSGTATTISG
ncbi:MAG TPA: hypothetical protein VF331_21960 [Polyangiales bacterium]